jgi:hypothetical protein
VVHGPAVQYAAEEINVMNRDEEKKSSYAYQMLRAGAWPRENPQFWEQIDQSLIRHSLH